LPSDAGGVQDEPGKVPSAVERQIGEQRDIIPLGRSAGIGLPGRLGHLTDLPASGRAFVIPERSQPRDYLALARHASRTRRSCSATSSSTIKSENTGAQLRFRA